MDLPPLFSPLASAGADPFAVAVAEARAGCDAGLVVYDFDHERLRAAIVFAPEVTLSQAVIMLPLCGIGFQNALGALGPPEVAVHLGWDGTLRVNGAVCGTLSMAAAPRDPGAEPDWLVISLDLALWAPMGDTGLTPDTTTLAAEGCGDVEPGVLLPAWLRHTLVWLTTWEDEGNAPLHREWIGLAHGIGTDTVILGQAGHFTGVDADFGLLLKTQGGTRLLPLSDVIRDVP
ncbi:biotin/lipoate--protein ligase family protein [Oceaniglobus ichthyenteri]|uniref:biotin/lipoate--protein ligase family protein n=1 Tax=Oceaniglobus ichthyenteri TaxID=2136177 RepID=UPI000D3D88D2|nr:biotin/lipoate--protein ligase family protein [Oceaniglobus ichthyenteri]